MKADRCGMMSEQYRFNAGWKPASALKGNQAYTGRRCKDCLHIHQGLVNPVCPMMHNVTTSVHATCDKFEPKP